MKKDKVYLAFIAVLAILVLATSCLYALEAEDFRSLIPVLVIAVIIIAMAFFVLTRYKDVRKGMPLHDERSKKVMHKAAATSFYVSLYWLLFISFFEGFFAKMFQAEHLTASQTVGGGIAGMAIMFLIFWVYYNKKG